MTQPAISSIPGMSAVAGTLDFMKSLWGGMNIPAIGIPGMVMPSLSVEEINKQISDLKAVESWLNLNMNMLRGTIQALEVQSATLSALQSMGETLSAAVKSGTGANSQAVAAWPSRPKSGTEASAQPAPAAEMQDSAGGPESEERGAAKSAEQQGSPTAWWNLLQDQFKQAVTAVLANEAPKNAARPEPERAKPVPPMPQTTVCEETIPLPATSETAARKRTLSKPVAHIAEDRRRERKATQKKAAAASAHSKGATKT